MNSTPFFLAKRILFTHVYHKSISTMTLICFAGIFIGTFSLALITAIMNGFEVAIHQKMQGIHAHIIIQSYKNSINMEVLSPVLQKEFPEITAFSPTTTNHILLRTQNSEDETPLVAIIKGIEPSTEQYTSSLSQKILPTTLSQQEFPALFMGNRIIIGKQLARNNNLAVGDTIELLFLRNGQVHRNKATFDTEQAIISGIFDTGIDEFDSNVVYCSLNFLETLFPNIAIDQINVTIKHDTNEQAVIKKLQHRLGLDVYSWKDLYPSLVATLKLEKYVSFFIIALILLVASMNIISLLFMQITQKRPVIAILKTMGMSDSSISSIFFIMGMIISCIASISGLGAAVLTSYLLNRYPFITLPDTYYVTQLPVAMNINILLAVFCVVIIFSFCATLLPTRRISAINISHVLRFEG